jgi:hypothetical protein
MEFRHVLETVRLIAVPAAGLMESGYLVTSLAGDPVAAGQPAQVAALRYTNHRPTATAAEIVPLHIKGSFAPGDRAKILRAVNEWNVALNGFVPFTIVVDSGASAATAALARPWSIMAALLPCPPWGRGWLRG